MPLRHMHRTIVEQRMNRSFDADFAVLFLGGPPLSPFFTLAAITRVVCDDALSERERKRGIYARDLATIIIVAVGLDRSLSLPAGRVLFLLPLPVARNSLSLRKHFNNGASFRRVGVGGHIPSSPLMLRHRRRAARNLWILAPRTATRTHLIMGEQHFNRAPHRCAAQRSHDFFRRIFSQGGWIPSAN